MVGHLAPHIAIKVDCESLFSQAGHQSQLTRDRTISETYERSVKTKHHISRIHCCKNKVLNKFLDRTTKKNYQDSEDAMIKSFGIATRLNTCSRIQATRACLLSLRKRKYEQWVLSRKTFEFLVTN